ncbi:hypothetical protein [uncultured Tessaracoccus sp.]|uniref:hypothetical protein n=1 Tax=uncultured Tessaracoccus sp. TaxID=905023 RepID=UPI002613622C|nr:hypothetical protein [uncultured Tessaracoccus sp.]
MNRTPHRTTAAVVAIVALLAGCAPQAAVEEEAANLRPSTAPSSMAQDRPESQGVSVPSKTQNPATPGLTPTPKPKPAVNKTTTPKPTPTVTKAATSKPTVKAKATQKAATPKPTQKAKAVAKKTAEATPKPAATKAKATKPKPEVKKTKATSKPKKSTKKATATPAKSKPAKKNAAPAKAKATKPKQKSKSRLSCAQVWAEAQTYLAAPAGAVLECVPTGSFGQGKARGRWRELPDGSRDNLRLWATVDIKAARKGGATDKQIVGLAVHEIAHLHVYPASAEARAAHYRALGTTEAGYRAGNYYNKPSERFASAAARCLVGVKQAKYTQISCSTFNAALGALR